MAQAAVQTLDISPVGRVEGDLDVRVEVQDGHVVNAWTQAELFRGFEIILRDKDPQAGLVVTPRACGICGASHLTCAAWALDTAWGTTVPRNAILARNLGQLAESLQSLPRHHYGLFMIDYTNKAYAGSPFYEEAVKRWSPFTGANYEIGVTISGRPVEIYALLGGQWPHSSYMVPGGVMCAPTLTDVTRAWAILEHFRRNWLEPIWLGCSLERYEEIKTHDDFLAWLDERPEHANSDLGLYWRMSQDIGLDAYGKGHGKYISWGYLPHEDRYNKPTIEGRNAALIMKSGVYDGATDSHKLMDQSFAREDMLHAWYDEGDQIHPFDRTTRPVQKNDIDPNGKYSWATAVSHADNGRLEAGPLARQLVAGGRHGESWQHYDPLVLDMYRKLGGASVMLRHFARMHEGVKIYREMERVLRELRLGDEWYVKPTERDGRGWGATEAICGALCHWIEVKGGKIKNYQIIAPTTWNVGPRALSGERGPIEEALIGIPIRDPHDPVEVGHVCRSYDSCLVCTVHAHDARTGEELARFMKASSRPAKPACTTSSIAAIANCPSSISPSSRTGRAGSGGSDADKASYHMMTVIGCGNLNRRDDGVGVIVARRLAAQNRAPSDRVKIFDAGTGGMEIMFQVRGTDRLVLIDACASGSDPGAVFEVPGDELESDKPPTHTLHDFRWDHALYAGRRIFKDAFPRDVTVFLIEAKTLAYGLDLSPEVERAAAIVTARIGALIEAHARATT